MTTLLIDGLIALIKLIDRGVSAVEKNVSHRAAPDDSQPAGAGEILPPNPGTGGNPHEVRFNPDIVLKWHALNVAFDPELTEEFTRTDPVVDPELLLLQAAVYLDRLERAHPATAREIRLSVALPPVSEVVAGLKDLQAQFAADADLI